MTEQQMISMALEEGFGAAAILTTDKIVFNPVFRPFCAENLCGKYGVNYSCPPDCGTPDQMKQRVLDHQRALVLQTIWSIPDLSDAPAIKNAKGRHNQASLSLMKKLRKEGIPGFLVGSSGCALCQECSLVRGEPCVLPDQQYSCMSAYCIYVRRLAEICQMEYSPGEGLVALFGMYVFD